MADAGIASPDIPRGTLLRSAPVFFLQDDHDYFEGDASTDYVVSFPPEPFMLELGRATQHLYYPEFLPDAGRPLGLAGTGARDRAAGASEAFGTLRCGKLLELLRGECRKDSLDINHVPDPFLTLLLNVSPACGPPTAGPDDRTRR